jgi:peptidoglycan/LPS O-acetylase OafA/YrhL
MYKKMSTLAGIAILMVVIAHAIKYGLFALYAWTERYQHMLPANFDPYVDPFNTPQWYFLVFGQTFTVFSVPAFFTISGFFIAFAIDKNQENIRWETIKKRIVSLVSPYLVWTIILIILRLVRNQDMLPIDFFLQFFGFVGGLWFIPTIIQFYFLSPLLIFLAQKNWKLLLLSSGLLQILLILIKYTFYANINAQLFRKVIYGNLEQMFVYSMFFFVLGIVIGLV